GEEAGQRDPDLDGGQEPVGVAGEPDQAERARGALTLELLELTLPQRDQGELGAGEGRVDEDENENEAEVQPITRHPIRTPLLVVRAPMLLAGILHSGHWIRLARRPESGGDVVSRSHDPVVDRGAGAVVRLLSRAGGEAGEDGSQDEELEPVT